MVLEQCHKRQRQKKEIRKVEYVNPKVFHIKTLKDFKAFFIPMGYAMSFWKRIFRSFIDRSNSLRKMEMLSVNNLFILDIKDDFFKETISLTFKVNDKGGYLNIIPLWIILKHKNLVSPTIKGNRNHVPLGYENYLITDSDMENVIRNSILAMGVGFNPRKL